MANLEGKLGDAEVRLTQVESVISTRDKEIVDLKIVVVQSEDKCYNMGFANTKSSSSSLCSTLGATDLGRGGWPL